MSSYKHTCALFATLQSDIAATLDLQVWSMSWLQDFEVIIDGFSRSLR